MTNSKAGFYILLLGLTFLSLSFILAFWDKNRAKKYSSTTVGTVVEHKWVHGNNISYPCAVLEYYVSGQKYICRQTYRSVCFNSMKHAEFDWNLDKDYSLHSYVTRKCKNHINPAQEWFPIGSQMPVYYTPQNPKKAYSGALRSLKLVQTISGCMGIFMVLFGILLQFV